MKSIIIGSTAAKHWFPTWRNPKDLDVLSTEPISDRGIDAQCHPLAELIIDSSIDKTYADPNLLYTLKVSHAYWNIHWAKTMADIYEFQKRGCFLDQELHDALVKMWMGIHGNKKVNLNQTKDTFWDDGVRRKYDHEYLHELIAFHGRPLHESLHVDGHQIMMDRNKFFSLPFNLQCDAALEEILTIAVERKNLSVKSKKSERLHAFSKAHFILCTSAAKGWFAQFLVENHFHLKYVLRDRWYSQLDKALQLL